MDSVLLLGALLTLLAGGAGVAVLLAPDDRSMGGVELAALSMLLGAGLIGAVTIGASAVFGSARPPALGAAACLLMLLAGIGVWRARATPLCVAVPRGWGAMAAGLAALQLAAVGAITLGTPLGWDGLWVWEYKARVLFLAKGSLPLAYMTDPTRAWSHSEYPLLLPYLEAWLYAWVGRPDQVLVKWVFPPLYAATMGLLYAGVLRLGGTRQYALVAGLLWFFVPIALFGPGSLSSGLADGVVGVYYLASAVYLLDYVRNRNARALWLVAVLAATLPWIKNEGAILWACLTAVTLAVGLTRRTVLPALAVGLPGLGVLVSWKTLLTVLRVSQGHDFLPVTAKTLAEHWSRLGEIAVWMAGEMTRLQSWGPLWLVFTIALVLPGLWPSQELRAALGALVLLPLAGYTILFIFTKWPLLEHMELAAARLLLQVAPVALLGVALALQPAGGKHDSAVRPS